MSKVHCWERRRTIPKLLEKSNTIAVSIEKAQLNKDKQD
jgi:hypothetical protein